MKILALDTATEALSVSLCVGEQQLDRYVEIERGHAEQLLPLVEEVLAEGGVGLGELDAIAFGRGPGGFTGVRLAASAAQGLAYGAGIGVVPVSDLMAVAQQVIAREPAVERVLVVNDARMREVYWAEYPNGPTPYLYGRGGARGSRRGGSAAGRRPPLGGRRPWVAGLAGAGGPVPRSRGLGAPGTPAPRQRNTGPGPRRRVCRAGARSHPGAARICQGSRGRTLDSRIRNRVVNKLQYTAVVMPTP